MKIKTTSKNKKAIASITIVLLLGFLSILVVTSIFTYNAWRWENLESGIQKERYNNAIDGIGLMQYTLLMRSMGVVSTGVSYFDSHENVEQNFFTTASLSEPGLIEDICRTMSLPAEDRVFWAQIISASNQKGNFFNQKECCIAAWHNNDRVRAEESINKYSTIRCKNMNWPNLKDTDEALMVSKIIQ